MGMGEREKMEKQIVKKLKVLKSDDSIFFPLSPPSLTVGADLTSGRKVETALGLGLRAWGFGASPGSRFQGLCAFLRTTGVCQFASSGIDARSATS